MVWDDPDALTQRGLLPAAREIEHAVFLVQTLDHRVRITEYQPVSCPDRRRDQVARQAMEMEDAPIDAD
jgi:hypothetical protein